MQLKATAVIIEIIVNRLIDIIVFLIFFMNADSCLSNTVRWKQHYAIFQPILRGMAASALASGNPDQQWKKSYYPDTFKL